MYRPARGGRSCEHFGGYKTKLNTFFSREDVKEAKESKSWQDVQDFYATTFDSFLEVNATFKVSHVVLV